MGVNKLPRHYYVGVFGLLEPSACLGLEVGYEPLNVL